MRAIASKCQGGLAPNIHIPFRLQDDVLTIFVFLGFWGSLCLGFFVGLVLCFCMQLIFMDACIGSVLFIVLRFFFNPARSPSRLLSPLLFCDTFLYFLQQQSVPSQ